MNIKHVKGDVAITGLQWKTAVSDTETGTMFISEDEASRLLSDDMKNAIAEAKRYNADAKRKKIEELETELRKLKESLVIVDAPRRKDFQHE